MTPKMNRLILSGLCVMLCAGCSTPPEKTDPVLTPSPDAKPIKAAFVYDEEVHAVGARFSLEQEFWRSFFPPAASAFTEVEKFETYDKALKSDATLIVTAKNVIHGSKRKFQYGLEVTVKDFQEKFIMKKGFDGKALTPGTVAASLEADGREMEKHFDASRKIYHLSK